jgi:hypothetical protein
MVSSVESLCTDSCQRACLLTTGDELALQSCLTTSCGCEDRDYSEQEQNATAEAEVDSELITLLSETEAQQNNETSEITDEELQRYAEEYYNSTVRNSNIIL